MPTAALPPAPHPTERNECETSASFASVQSELPLHWPCRQPGKDANTMARGPERGEKASSFELESTHGPISLASRLATRAVLLVFYPADDSPVCTRQLCDYRDHLQEFAGLGVDILAINPASLDSHRAFAQKHGLPFPLLSDPTRDVCRAYGAVGLLGMTRRSLFLIGRSGSVVYRKTDLPIFHRTAEELRKVIASADLG
jgi:peroxiredoxin Q/BCP